MPYISYVDLASWLDSMYTHALNAFSSYVNSTSAADRSAIKFKAWCDSSSNYNDVFICDGYRLCRAAKLLMALGYGNFSAVIQYDVYAMGSLFLGDNQTFDFGKFGESEYYLDLTNFEADSITNSPNLSLFPLLAYHKICNDHYRNEKWQPFEPWTCNIDYLSPTGNMNAKSFIESSTFTTLMTSIIDLENSNLPIDYFTSVLPRAQYGDESATPAEVAKVTTGLLIVILPTSTGVADSSPY